MSRSRDDFDPKQPTLIVKYGTTKKKYRPLLRDVTVLGRGSGCDIGLISPEVAPVHCVIVRLASGWILRDCSGRATRVNGEAVTEEPLKDGDTITVGTFSFEAHLPPLPPPGAPARYAHMEKSRKRMAQLAIRMRARVREVERDDAERGRQQEELTRMEEMLRSARAESQGRRDALDARRAELDAYARHLRREAQQTRDQAHQEEADAVRQRVELDAERQRLEQLQAELQARLAELDGVTDSLEDEREAVRAEQDQVAKEREYLDQQRKELVRERQAITNRDTKMDEAAPDRLESARRLLRDVKARRAGQRQ